MSHLSQPIMNTLDDRFDSIYSMDMTLTVFLFVGECKSIPDCEEGELEDFPRRMREWLFNVMEELADRGQLTPHFSKLHKEGKV